MKCRQLDGMLILLVALISGMPGCAMLGQSPGNCRRGPEPTPTVRTGGQYAVARIIPIPPEGLPLSDAVESSLRPGIIAMPAASNYGVVPAGLPVADVPIPRDDLIRAELAFHAQGQPAEVQELLRKKAAAIVGIIELPPATDKSVVEALTNEILTALTSAYKDGTFRSVAGSDVAQNKAINAAKKKLVQDIQNIIPRVTAPPTTPAVTAAVAPALVDRLAVVLSRAGGRRIIIPLHMVRTNFPGDIRLADGDRIDVIPFDQTAAAQRPDAGATATVAVTSWSANEGLIVPLAGAEPPSVQQLVGELESQPSDVVILRRMSDLTGVEEYMLSPADARRLSQTYLQDRDLVHFDVLSMTSLIRDSQAQLGNVASPPSGGCGSSPNGFLGLKGLDRQCKTFTGVSGADVAGQTQRGLQNLGGLVSSGAP